MRHQFHVELVSAVRQKEATERGRPLREARHERLENRPVNGQILAFRYQPRDQPAERSSGYMTAIAGKGS
jgi:hypothetical protein